MRGHAWAPARAPQTPQGGVPPWALGSASRQILSVLTPTSPQAPQRENDNSRTCVGKPGRQAGRRKRHKEVYLLGCWAPQADQTSTSSPRPATTRKRQQPLVRGRAWAPARALQTPQGGVPPWALGSSSPPTIDVLTPDTSAPTSTTTTHKGHEPYLLGRAGVAENSRSARSSCRATPQAAGSTGGHNATRTKTFLGVGHLGAQIHAVNPTSAIRRSSNGAGTDARCSLPLRPLNRAQHRKAHSCHHRVASEGYPLGESGVRSVCACWEPQGARASTQRGGCQVKRSCVCRRRSACHAGRCVRPGRSCDTTGDPSRPLVDRPTEIAIRPPTASSNFERCTWSIPY